jgi:hypothetical protein
VKSFAMLLEEELANAFEVTDKKSLHRYITILAENIVQRTDYVTDSGSIHNDIGNLMESMKVGLAHMDRRFEDMLTLISARFEASDKRFEDMRSLMDKRFEDMQSSMNTRFEDLRSSMSTRFEASDKRFENLTANMDRRFNRVSAFLGLGFIFIGTLVTIFEFLT